MGAVVELTPLGRKKAEEIGHGGPAYSCLAALYENGPLTVEEVAGEAGLSYDEAKVQLRKLAKMGLVRRAA